MQISGDKLLFLIQVLRDSLNIEKTQQWTFQHSHDAREKFFENFMDSILGNLSFEIKEKDTK